jgi:hypothetical protein
MSLFSRGLSPIAVGLEVFAIVILALAAKNFVEWSSDIALAEFLTAGASSTSEPLSPNLAELAAR